MKRIAPFLLVALVLACVIAPVAWAASNPSAGRPADRSPGAPLASAVSTVTGIAISPLLGTGALGAYQWFTAEESARPRLPWYAQPKFWLPALLIVVVVAAKDSLGTVVPPVLKKPLDMLEVAENKFSGLIAAGAVIPFAMDAFSRMILQSSQAGSTAPTGLAMIQFLGLSWAPVLDVLMIPFGVAVFVVVWMASHAINVLILLSPWGAIDAGLKAARTGLLGLLTLTATMNPMVGAVLSLVVVVFAYFIAGWAFRLTVFGSIMCWDFFTRRRLRFVPSENANKLFSGVAFDGVPVRTYGRLVRQPDGRVEFVYRPWLVREPQAVSVPAPAASLAAGVGLFVSVITLDSGATLFLLPQRYRGHEEELVRRYGLGGGVRPAGLRKAWGSLKELIGGRAAAPEPALTA